MAIHPTAVVSPKAEIGNNVEIGPYTVIEDDVKIGDDCYIDAHVKIAAASISACISGSRRITVFTGASVPLWKSAPTRFCGSM